MHQTVGNILHTLLHAHPPNNIDQAQDLMDTALVTASHAMHAAIHCTLHISPGALVFHRDMFLDIPLLANLQAIHNRRQVLIDENNHKANLKCICHDYCVGELIMLVVLEPTKLDSKLVGPFPILQVHVNGNLTIQCTPWINERINIHWVRPYRQ
jgi:hypothetical protein